MLHELFIPDHWLDVSMMTRTVSSRTPVVTITWDIDTPGIEPYSKQLLHFQRFSFNAFTGVLNRVQNALLRKIFEEVGSKLFYIGIFILNEIAVIFKS